MDMHFEGVIFQTHALELSRRVGKSWPPFVLIDIRSTEEFNRGHIEGALHAPVQVLREGGIPEGADAGSEFIIVGREPEDPDVRSASLLLKKAGARRLVELAGGMVAWDHGRYPVSKADAA